MARYPAELERPGLLRDGRSLLVRPTRPDDLDQLLAFSGRLSRRTVSYRMLGPVVTMDREAVESFLDIDYDHRLTLLGILNGTVIGIAEYIRVPGQPDRAEIAFTVEDAYQGLGLGGLLLEHLAAAARDRGIEVFEADVLADNARMLRTFDSSGYRTVLGEPGSIQHIDIAVDPRRQVIRRSDRRERMATRGSLHPLFAPGSIAVIGANRQHRKVGSTILGNLLAGGFAGPVYAVNPHAADIDGVRCYPSIADVPGPVDLAVVAVPAPSVPGVVAECAGHAVSAVIVVTTGVGGLTADGPDGRPGTGVPGLVRFARAHGMRLVGPSSMGLLSLNPGTNLVATFSPTVPPAGRVSMASQSGPLGLAVLDHSRRLGLGFSGFVSLGDSADVSPNDLLQWWETDRSTSVVLLHLERVGNPRKFARVARRLAARKPLIAVQAGPPAPAPTPGPADRGRSGVLRPGDSDAAMSALFRQTGIIRARTMQEMFDTALLLANQPVPPGPRVAVLTNAGGPGALTAGACRAAGLVLARPSEATATELRARISGLPDMSNPVDLTPLAVAGHYRIAMAGLLADPGVDAVIALFIPPLVDDAGAVAEALVETSAAVPGKPVAASFLSYSGLPPQLRGKNRHIPSYLFPESAATALGHAAAYGDWLRRPAGVVRDPEGLDVSRARDLVARHRPGELDQKVTAELLGCFGLHLADGSAGGRDMTLSVATDPIFGPVIALSLADDYARVLGDVAFGVTPVSDRDAESMLRSLRAHRLLADLNEDTVIDAVLRVSAMVEKLPELAELAIDRMRIGPPGTPAVVLDAAARLAHPPTSRFEREATVDR